MKKLTVGERACTLYGGALRYTDRTYIDEFGNMRSDKIRVGDNNVLEMCGDTLLKYVSDDVLNMLTKLMRSEDLPYSLVTVAKYNEKTGKMEIIKPKFVRRAKYIVTINSETHIVYPYRID